MKHEEFQLGDVCGDEGPGEKADCTVSFGDRDLAEQARRLQEQGRGVPARSTEAQCLFCGGSIPVPAVKMKGAAVVCRCGQIQIVREMEPVPKDGLSQVMLTMVLTRQAEAMGLPEQVVSCSVFNRVEHLQQLTTNPAFAMMARESGFLAGLRMVFDAEGQQVDKLGLNVDGYHVVRWMKRIAERTQVKLTLQLAKMCICCFGPPAKVQWVLNGQLLDGGAELLSVST